MCRLFDGHSSHGFLLSYKKKVEFQSFVTCDIFLPAIIRRRIPYLSSPFIFLVNGSFMEGEEGKIKKGMGFYIISLFDRGRDVVVSIAKFLYGGFCVSPVDCLLIFKSPRAIPTFRRTQESKPFSCVV